jgi:phosphoribosylformylglycinamidine cyclo-ligase
VGARDGHARAAYAEAGVDVAAGDRAVALIREELAGRRAARGPALEDLLGGLRGFAAAVPIPAGMREPVIVCATDGVGTKTEIARTLGRRDTIGRDLVAMCADDVVCHGARPYVFLDYIAVGRVEPESIAELVRGVAAGCEEASCSLVGGETAEHPGLMVPDAFDLAGFCVGIAERGDLLDGRSAEVGDTLIGIASSGLHANGYSLVRALLERYNLDLAMPFRELAQRTLGNAVAGRLDIDEPEAAGLSLGEVLLTPTRIYAPDVLGLRSMLRGRGLRLSGLAHVTGGGLPGNLPRAVGPELGVRIHPGSWPLPAIFRVVAALGGLSGAELRATLNAGIGMAAIVEREAAGPALGWLAEHGLAAWKIGDVRPTEELGPARYVEELA